MPGKHEEAHKEHINKYKMAHMIGVAEYMRERAEDYNNGFCNGSEPIRIDPNEAYVVGLLHDIGYIEGRSDHEAIGADLLTGMGLRGDLLDAIRYHGTNPYEIEASLGRTNEDGTDVIPPIMVLLYEADMSIDIQGYRVGFDKRLKDIAARNMGTPYEEAAISTSTATVRYVKEWQAEHGVDKPAPGFWHKHSHTHER